MKAIKKACSGTSLYPKSSSVSSKLKTGGKIKKAVNGTTTPKTTVRPKAKPEPQSRKFLRPDDTKSGPMFPTSGVGTNTLAKDGKWIQKAINPKHKGYCTPMTKATCTPKRKALAKTLKAMAAKRKGK